MNFGYHVLHRKTIDSVFRGVSLLLLLAITILVGMDFHSLASGPYTYVPRTLFDYFLKPEHLSLADYILKNFALISPPFVLACIYMKSRPILGLVWSIIAVAMTLSNILVYYLMACQSGEIACPTFN
jgi:hypothetical protein